RRPRPRSDRPGAPPPVTERATMQADQKRKAPKKLFTIEEANATLPLLRSILRDVTELAREVRDRHERLGRIRQGDRQGLSRAHDEELEGIQGELERARVRMEDYEQELRGLGVVLK